MISIEILLWIKWKVICIQIVLFHLSKHFSYTNTLWSLISDFISGWVDIEMRIVGIVPFGLCPAKTLQ